MDCPVDAGPLTRVNLEGDALGLPGFACGRCAGHWIRFGDFLAWRERQPGDVPELPSDANGEVAETAAGASSAARRCPDCGHLLTRYRVGHGVAFTLDRCGHCNGVWLDGGEWTALRARGLHDDLHRMFGPGWQFAARTEARRHLAEAQFERQLGDDIGRAREFAEWVAGHPRRSEILAYVHSRVR